MSGVNPEYPYKPAYWNANGAPRYARFYADAETFDSFGCQFTRSIEECWEEAPSAPGKYPVQHRQRTFLDISCSMYPEHPQGAHFATAHPLARDLIGVKRWGGIEAGTWHPNRRAWGRRVNWFDLPFSVRAAFLADYCAWYETRATE
jgi:hypothetical protein